MPKRRKTKILPNRMRKSMRLRRLRERLGESQGTFARRFQIGRTTLLRWEAGGYPSYRPLTLHIEGVCREIEKRLEGA